MHNYCGRKLGVVAHEGSNKENTHLVPEKSGRKLGVVAREGVVLRSFTVIYKCNNSSFLMFCMNYMILDTFGCNHIVLTLRYIVWIVKWRLVCF